MTELLRSARRIQRGYAHGEPRPLRGYLVTLGAYGAVTAALAAAARISGRSIPPRIGMSDVALCAVATHKVSRLLTKDAITSPLRAPFTRYDEPAGDGEVNEEVRGEGTRHAVGELVNCPFCTAVWVATGLSAGLVFAPRLTRLVAATFTAVAGSDFLQLGYDLAKQAAERSGS